MINGTEMLDWLQSRRSVRRFTERPIERAVLERLLLAATSAPSSTNRQPWRFAVVTDPNVKRRIASVVRAKTQWLQEVISRGHHAEDFGAYGDFFFEPLEAASALVIPQYRPYPDQLAGFIRSGRGDLSAFQTPDAMQPEHCATSAAVMLMLLQARAEGLGACWMAGPMVAKAEVQQLVEVISPYEMLGVVALGYPAETPTAQPRRSLTRVVRWFEESEHDDE